MTYLKKTLLFRSEISFLIIKNKDKMLIILKAYPF